MIAPTLSKVTDVFPTWQVLDLPFIIENDQQIYTALHGELSTQLLNELDSIHVKGLTFWNNGFKQMAAKSQPILEVEDFNNLHVRIMPSTILHKQFTLLDAKPTVITFNDLYKQLQDEQIIAQENTISNLYSKGFYEIQNEITLSNHGILAYAVMMNGDFWDSLDPEAQQIITETIDDMKEWQHTESILLNKKNFEQLQAKESVNFHTLTQAQLQQWKDELQPIYNYYEKNIEHYLFTTITQRNY